MEYNLGGNMVLPDSFENDFDNEDIAHEQIKQNEVKIPFSLMCCFDFCIY